MPNRKEQNTMECRFLGASGFRVPVLGFGAGTFKVLPPALEALCNPTAA